MVEVGNLGSIIQGNLPYLEVEVLYPIYPEYSALITRGTLPYLLEVLYPIYPSDSTLITQGTLPYLPGILYPEYSTLITRGTLP